MSLRHSDWGGSRQMVFSYSVTLAVPADPLPLIAFAPTSDRGRSQGG